MAKFLVGVLVGLVIGLLLAAMFPDAMTHALSALGVSPGG